MTASLDPVISSAPAKRSFLPIVDARARVLVLGTLPGEESSRGREYYAHPRNLFWPIVFALFDTTPVTNYQEKLAFVAAQRIALWDVCELGERDASADFFDPPRATEHDRPAARHPSADPRRRFQRHHCAPPL